jgi:ankyrin repeat protein
MMKCALMAHRIGETAVLLLLISSTALAAKTPATQASIHDLELAVSRNDVRLIRDLINKGANPNERFQLHRAVMFNHLEACSVLLKGGAEVELKDDDGLTPLMLAAQRGEPAIIKLLLAAGANPETTDPAGWTAYLHAVRRLQKKERVRSLEQLTRNKERLNDVLLFVDVNKRDLAGTRSLLKQGVSPNVRNYLGDTVLIETAGVHAPEFIKLLLAAGADPNLKNKRGITPLMKATESPLSDTVSLLILARADVNAKVDKQTKPVGDLRDGMTPLMFAAASGRIAAVELLLAHGARIEDVDDRGCTALMHAASFGKEEMQPGKYEVTRILLSKGAQINAADHDGKTPLMHAAWSDNTRLIGLLLMKGAPIEARDNSGRTPLWHALYYENILTTLITHGADVNAPDSAGKTPLMDAARSNNKETVELLLQYGADPSLKDSAGKLARDYASDGKIVTLLQRAQSLPIHGKK